MSLHWSVYIGFTHRNVSDTFKENSTKLIDEIIAPLNAVGVPFSSTYGVIFQSELKIEHYKPLLYSEP